MDKNDTVYREHSAKEHFILAGMILLAFIILTSHYNSDLLPAFATGSPTGAAAAVINLGSVYVWGIIILLLILGIILGIILWWRNHKKIQVQRALQQDVDTIIKAAGKSSKPATADHLTRKLTKVQQELVDIPLRSATTGHIIKTIPSDYGEVPLSPRPLRLLLPRKVKVPRKAVPRHKIKHRLSLDEKMLKIKKEIGGVKTRP